jgi:hypothetical protein
MRADLYWVCQVGAGRLGIVPRPRGGDWLSDELRSLRGLGVDVVLSLLEAQEVEELDIVEEESLCEANEYSINIPVMRRLKPCS